MKKILFYLVSGIFMLILVQSCKKKEETPEPVVIPAETIATNKWIFENLTAYYLWTDLITPGIDYTLEPDPEAYFYKLLYTDVDKWSYITSDYATLAADLNGTPVTMGYYPAFYLIGSNRVAIAVAYVYPGSPAADAGLKRGDIILSINNTALDTINYYEKYSGTSYSVQLGTVSGNTIVNNGTSLSMTARLVNADPAIDHKVIDIEGHKIGYLAYVEFISGDNDKFLLKMDSIFNEFRDSAVTDLIVDLRYNPGGEINAAIHLASEIAPASVTAANEVMINLKYNNDLQAYLEDNNLTDNLFYKFTSIASNINMQRAYFLTTSRSASASELVMVGLDPFMQITRIGEATYGKYVGSFVIPDDNEKWAMMPIVMKYANANGFTDFVNGLAPDYEISDDLFGAPALGNITDPMVAKAVELATGVTLSTTKSGPSFSRMFRKIVPDEMKLKSNLFIPGITRLTK
ncbi:MAG: S41 family peptidase [Bacteroidales bacterium]